MVYVEKKDIYGKKYYYLKESTRVGAKVKTKTLAYFGKAKPTMEEIEKEMQRLKINNYSYIEESKLSELEKIKEDFLKKLKKLDYNTKKQMWADFITNFVFNTNAIEGNTINLRETAMLLYEGITPSGKELREVYDHRNSKEAFEFILENKPQINDKTILQIHEILMKNIDVRVRAYRTQDVRVLGATFKSSPAVYVKIDMELLIKWYKKNEKKLNPLILATMFHHKFEKIHPFFDGNGRTGRLLLNLILLRNNYPPMLIEKERRIEYCEALSKADKSGIGEMKPEQYAQVISYFYNKFVKTYEAIFSKWG